MKSFLRRVRVIFDARERESSHRCIAASECNFSKLGCHSMMGDIRNVSLFNLLAVDPINDSLLKLIF